MVIRIKDLPLNGAPNANQFVATDLASTEKLTIQDLVDTGAPIASQATAEAGTDNNDRMTALATAQAIAFQAATAAQGDLADTAVQPGDLAAVATSGNYNDLSDQPSLSADLIYPVKADAEAATIPLLETALRINGDVTVGDGLGGLYIDTDNGSTDTFVSSGGTARTWYRAPDVSASRLTGPSDIRSFLDTAPYVATRTAAKALDTTKDTTLILTEAGREGVFKWTTGDFSAEITADTAEGVYLKADAIASTSGAWVRVFDGRADVRWFGAVGDGVTNDSAAIQACIDYLEDRASPYNGGVCYIPSGIWLASGLILKVRVFIQGDGPGATVIQAPAGANEDVLTVPLGFSMGGWDGITIDGDQAGNTSGHGIYFEATANNQGQSFSPFDGKPVQASYSYKMLSGTNFIVGNCAENGIDLNGYCFDVKLTNFRSSNNAGHGMMVTCTDGFFSDAYIEKNGLCGIYSTSGANKYVSIKSIWNGRTSNTVGSIAGVYMVGQANHMLGVEAQDNYCDGFYLGGVDNIWILDSNRNGYLALGDEDQSSRIHANYRFDSSTRRAVFKGASFTYATAVGSDGFWTTEYPYWIIAGAEFSSFECNYEPGVFNSAANTTRRMLSGDAMLDMAAFSTDGNVNTFLDISPKGSSVNTIRTGRNVPSGASWVWNFYQSGVATIRHAFGNTGPTTFSADNDGNLIVGKASDSTGGKWNTSHFQLGAYHLWVDSTGDLRIKSSAPTSDTDGTVVGTQS